MTEGRLSSAEAAGQEGKLLRNIKTARQDCEAYTERQLITATWTLKLDTWYEPGFFVLTRVGTALMIPRPPLQSVTSVKYRDATGVQVTWASESYLVDAPQGPRARKGRIAPVFGTNWPVAQTVPEAIEIEFKAGYGDAPSDIPEPLVDGIIARCLEMYELRGNAIADTRVAVVPVPLGSERLWFPFRVF